MLGKAGILFVLAGAASPQDLAPEVLLLSHITHHLDDEMAHVPNYTCLETVTRFHNNPGGRVQALTPLDTVRLEVVYTDGKEWYGSPGARSLTVNNPVRFIGAGMIGNGSFGMMLSSILAGATFTYRGEEEVNGKTAVRYDYRLSSFLKPLHISLLHGSGMVGEEGSLWVDKQSLDLIRLESRASEIPPSLPLDFHTGSIAYARMRIGERDVLLAEEAESHMRDSDGVESYNRMDFTHCRAYSASSAIRFDTVPAGEAQAAPASVPAAPNADGLAIPALMKVTVQLTTPISDRDSVGTLIEGRVSGAVRNKGATVIPDGAAVHGRIRRLEHFADGANFAVGLEFTEVDLPSGPAPFYADLLSMDKDPQIQPSLSSVKSVLGPQGAETAKDTITLPELPGVASFFVKGKSFTLPENLRTVWRTRGPIH